MTIHSSSSSFPLPATAFRPAGTSKPSDELTTLAECLNRVKECPSEKAPTCKVFFNDMNDEPVDLATEICTITQCTILELLADRPAQEEMLLLLACDSSFRGANNVEHPVRRLMTLEVLDGWFEKKQATQGGRGFFDHMNRQPINSVKVFLFDPEKTSTNNENKTISPLCSIGLVSTNSDASSEVKEEVKKLLRTHRTFLKVLTNGFTRGSPLGKEGLVESLLASALLIKKRELKDDERDQKPSIGDSIISELDQLCPDVTQLLFSLACKIQGADGTIAKLAREQAEQMCLSKGEATWPKHTTGRYIQSA